MSHKGIKSPSNSGERSGSFFKESRFRDLINSFSSSHAS